MNRFKVVWLVLLISTFAMIGAMMYCRGIIGWMESHFGRQDSIFRDFPNYAPYKSHLYFLEHAWIGFAVLSILWAVFGFTWLKFTEEPKFKVVPIASIVATLVFLTVQTYYRELARRVWVPYITFVYIELGFFALVALWMVLGAVWFKTEKRR